MEIVVSTLLSIIGLYLLFGVIFSIIFLWKGVGKVDAGAQDTGMIFKLLLFPGMTVFWIFFLRKWLKST